MRDAWISRFGFLLKVGLIAAFVYLGAVYYERWTRPPLERSVPPPIKHPRDFYVFIPKSYITDAEAAERLVGKPLWVKEGYRWTCQASDQVLGPIEKILPTAVRRRGDDIALAFELNGRPCAVTIGAAGRVYVDEMFFIKDPRELFDHWPPEAWEKISKHEAETGMTEYQIVFSRGVGEVLRSSSKATTRIVDYKACQAARLTKTELRDRSRAYRHPRRPPRIRVPRMDPKKSGDCHKRRSEVS
jgi:hypothetical protein